MDHFQVTFTLALLLSILRGRHVSSCNVYPKDQYIEVGSDTEVFCETSCVRGKIFWTLDNKRIDGHLSKSLNTSHSVLSLTKFTQRSATLQCHSANTGLVIGGTIIMTYTKPSNILCVLHYKDRHQKEGVPQCFTCTWEHQMNSSLGIEYTVLVSSENNNQGKMCSSLDKTTCQSNLTEMRIYLSSNFTVTVRAKTNAWEAYSNPQDFYPYSILKIVPPIVNVSVMSANILWVQWNRSVARRKEDLSCEVKYTETASNKTLEVLGLTLKRKENGSVSKKVDICTKYSVSVRCALSGAPWSDWSLEQTVQTEINKNDVQLHLWRTVAKPDTRGIRKVRAMWTPIPATCKGRFHYTIRQAPYEQHTAGANHTETLCSNSTCSVEVDEDEHRMHLRVFHNETLLAEESVYIPATASGLPHVTEIHTSAVEGAILVSWTAPAQPVRAYVVDWTRDGKQYYWNESKSTNTSLLDLLDKKRYNITVTPLFDGRTGRGAHADQICSRIGDPAKVTVDSVRANDRTVTVSWITESQEECSGAVIHYTVFYSPQGGPTLNVTVDGTEREVVLRGLNPDTQYSLYIEATASTGTSKSIESLFKTKTFDPRMITVLSVCGSILIIFLLLLGLCCTIQCIKFKEKSVPDPGLSSLAQWLLPDHQKGTCLFPAFSNPSESFCDRVYTEEMQKAATHPSATGRYPASNEVEEYYVSTSALTPNQQRDKPDEHVETHSCSSEESTDLLSKGNKPCSPYRSQSSVETPDSGKNKKGIRVPVKQTERKAPTPVYVTLNMLKEGPLRDTESNSKNQEYVRSE